MQQQKIQDDQVNLNSDIKTEELEGFIQRWHDKLRECNTTQKFSNKKLGLRKDRNKVHLESEAFSLWTNFE